MLGVTGGTIIFPPDIFEKLETVFPGEIKRAQTDNGAEFCKHFADYLRERNIIHYWNYKGKPTWNGNVEKYNRTIQEEFVDRHELYLDEPEEFNQKLTDWLLWYNTERFHWSLNLTSPVDYLLNNGLVSKMSWTSKYYCLGWDMMLKYGYRYKYS